MQKNSKIIFAIISILLIITIIMIIFSEDRRDRLKNLYEELCNSTNYTFTMEELENELKYKIAIIQKGNDVCIDMYSANEHNSTLILQNQAYYIMHAEKEYYIFEDENVEANIVTSGINNILKNDYETRKRKNKRKRIVL